MKRQTLFWSLIILVTLFLHFTPLATTHAYFTDSVSMDGSIKLQTGTLGVSVASEPEINLSNETNSDLAINVKNIGSLNGKITVRSIEGIANGAQLENLTEYLEIIQQDSNDYFIDSQKGMELNFKLIKKEKFKEIKEMKLIFLIRISQRNLESDEIGFRDDQTLEVKIINNSDNSSEDGSGDNTGDNNGSGSDNGNDNDQDTDLPEKEWPTEESFGNKEHYLEDNLYYSVVDNQLTTISTGRLYMKDASNRTDEAISERINYLKSNKFSLGQNLQVVEAMYVPDKGFIVEIGVKEAQEVQEAKFNWLELHSNWSEYFKNVDINKFGLPVLLDSDFLAIKSQKNKDAIIYASQLGTVVTMATPNDNNNLWGKRAVLPLKEKILRNYEISFGGTNPEYFAFEFVSDSQFRITQNGNESGKKAELIFKNAAGKIVYQRKVESVNTYSKSDISELINVFDIATKNLNLTKVAEEYKGQVSLFVKLPEHYLANYTLIHSQLGEGFKIVNTSYSDDTTQMKIDLEYQSATTPEHKQVRFQFYDALTHHYSDEFISYSENNTTVIEKLETIVNDSILTSEDLLSIESNQVSTSETDSITTDLVNLPTDSTTEEP
ncbi:hypothetical protein [Enterococcus lemanii]|uniref:Uncharacterized protein n=1 Tax=Enterococcus lemanii TaxID=1159752 RepID=A0ABV9MT14_9ENTE|nr:hypothetical protein [Enterococcus lemanii]MBM7710297.1 hypothetical protein [Enterococcus lemanii]